MKAFNNLIPKIQITEGNRGLSWIERNKIQIEFCNNLKSLPFKEFLSFLNKDKFYSFIEFLSLGNEFEDEPLDKQLALMLFYSMRFEFPKTRQINLLYQSLTARQNYSQLSFNTINILFI